MIQAYDTKDLLSAHLETLDVSDGRLRIVDSYHGEVETPLSLHKYAYAHNNPIMGSDPTGLFFTYIGQFAGTGIRLLLRSPKVAAAVKGADAASTVADAVQIIGALAVGGTAAVNPALLAGLLLNVAPFGGVLKKIGVADDLLKKVGGRLSAAVRGTVDGASEGLTEAMVGMRRAGLVGNKAVQSIGDMGALATARGLGFKYVDDFPIHYRGFDGIFKNGDNWVIAEAKGGAAKLGTTVSRGGQMSKTWIKSHIETLRQRGYHSWADKLDKARIDGRIQGLVVSTPVDAAAGTVGNPTFVLKQWDQIDEMVF